MSAGNIDYGKKITTSMPVYDAREDPRFVRITKNIRKTRDDIIIKVLRDSITKEKGC